jgi:hypothetical protein
MTGGGDGKRVAFSEKSVTRRVADIIIRRKGYSKWVKDW